MTKSGLQTVKDVSRMIAKGSLYVLGAAAIATPAIDAASLIVNGTTPKLALEHGVWEASGYSASEGKFHFDKLLQSGYRTGAGAAMIYVAKKL